MYINIKVDTYIYIHNHLHIGTTRGNQLHMNSWHRLKQLSRGTARQLWVKLASEQVKVQVVFKASAGGNAVKTNPKNLRSLTPIVEVRTPIAEAMWGKT